MARATKDYPLPPIVPTPRDLEDLMKDGRAAATYRGHTLGPFARRFESSSGRAWATATCHCGAYVQCTTHPQPNEIDLGGDGLAVGCPKEA